MTLTPTQIETHKAIEEIQLALLNCRSERVDYQPPEARHLSKGPAHPQCILIDQIAESVVAKAVFLIQEDIEDQRIREQQEETSSLATIGADEMIQTGFSHLKRGLNYQEIVDMIINDAPRLIADEDTKKALFEEIKQRLLPPAKNTVEEMVKEGAETASQHDLEGISEALPQEMADVIEHQTSAGALLIYEKDDMERIIQIAEDLAENTSQQLIDSTLELLHSKGIEKISSDTPNRDLEGMYAEDILATGSQELTAEDIQKMTDHVLQSASQSATELISDYHAEEMEKRYTEYANVENDNPKAEEHHKAVEDAIDGGILNLEEVLQEISEGKVLGAEAQDVISEQKEKAEAENLLSQSGATLLDDAPPSPDGTQDTDLVEAVATEEIRRRSEFKRDLSTANTKLNLQRQVQVAFIRSLAAAIDIPTATTEKETVTCIQEASHRTLSALSNTDEDSKQQLCCIALAARERATAAAETTQEVINQHFYSSQKDYFFEQNNDMDSFLSLLSEAYRPPAESPRDLISAAALSAITLETPDPAVGLHAINFLSTHYSTNFKTIADGFLEAAKENPPEQKLILKSTLLGLADHIQKKIPAKVKTVAHSAIKEASNHENVRAAETLYLSQAVVMPEIIENNPLSAAMVLRQMTGRILKNEMGNEPERIKSLSLPLLEISSLFPSEEVMLAAMDHIETEAFTAVEDADMRLCMKHGIEIKSAGRERLGLDKPTEFPGNQEDVVFLKLPLTYCGLQPEKREEFSAKDGPRETFLKSLAPQFDGHPFQRHLARGENPPHYQVHHIVPLEYGGTNDPSNFVLISTKPNSRSSFNNFHSKIHDILDSQTQGMKLGETRVVEVPFCTEPVFTKENAATLQQYRLAQAEHLSILRERSEYGNRFSSRETRTDIVPPPRIGERDVKSAQKTINQHEIDLQERAKKGELTSRDLRTMKRSNPSFHAKLTAIQQGQKKSKDPKRQAPMPIIMKKMRGPR